MIEIRSLTKSYKTRGGGRHFVFRDANIRIPSNASIGILGGNGSGKSTMLRLLARMDYPDSGEIITDQSISWPVGLSGGFQGSLTGRENAAFVCRLHGLHGNELRERIKFVQEFADIGPYFDLPANTYSSGMRGKVLFGLSMAFDFDYYLVDEAFSVGDRHFVEKSRLLFKERTRHASLIVVSHNTNQLKSLCDVGIFLHEGKMHYFDDIKDAIKRYVEL